MSPRVLEVKIDLENNLSDMFVELDSVMCKNCHFFWGGGGGEEREGVRLVAGILLVNSFQSLKNKQNNLLCQLIFIMAYQNTMYMQINTQGTADKIKIFTYEVGLQSCLA